MSSFEKVIGYRSIKRELLQICDMIRNRAIYEEMGARLPHGLLLYGDPGLGKSLLAKCFIEESGLNTVTVRRDKGGDAFIDSIKQAFTRAKEEAPAIVFLDDMDKFANEDCSHSDAPEYVAVQAGIDDVKETDVFVIATANEICRLPDSLRRSVLGTGDPLAKARDTLQGRTSDRGSAAAPVQNPRAQRRVSRFGRQACLLYLHAQSSREQRDRREVPL